MIEQPAASSPARKSKRTVGMDVIVTSYHELVAALQTIDISAPARGAGRTTQHVERWSMARFLATFGDGGLIPYPLTVAKGERPDFRLDSGGTTTGVEVTEAVSEDFAHFDAIRQQGEADIAFVSTSEFRPGQPRRTGAELRGLLTARQGGKPWVSGAAEHEWAQVMEEAILEKSESANKLGFTLHERNWLLIYDGWSLPVYDTLCQAIGLLLERLAWSSVVFSDIFVERHDSFIHLAPPNYSVLQINDLWRE